MESEYQTVGQMYERLRLMIRQRNDTGFRLAVTDAVLEPRNPFEPASKRRPKSVVAITLILALVLALIFSISASITRDRWNRNEMHKRS